MGAPDRGPEWARWPRVAGAPRPELRPLIAGHYAGFTEASTPRHLVLPATTSVPLVLKIRESAHRPPAFVHGVHGSYAALEGDCAPSYLEVPLAPLGAYVLLGVPMDELNGHVVDIAELFGSAGRELADRVREAPAWERRFEIMDDFLLRRAQDGPRPSPAVGRAWRRLVATGGAVPIRRVAADVGWSHKHLITEFRRQIGLPPKTVARLIRFQRLLSRLEERRPPSWARIAADAGYADQAHLVRDFHEFTGVTPTEFLNRARASGRVGGDG